VREEWSEECEGEGETLMTPLMMKTQQAFAIALRPDSIELLTILHQPLGHWEADSTDSTLQQLWKP